MCVVRAGEHVRRRVEKERVLRRKYMARGRCKGKEKRWEEGEGVRACVRVARRGVTGLNAGRKMKAWRELLRLQRKIFYTVLKEANASSQGRWAWREEGREKVEEEKNDRRKEVVWKEQKEVWGGRGINMCECVYECMRVWLGNVDRRVEIRVCGCVGRIEV